MKKTISRFFMLYVIVLAVAVGCFVGIVIDRKVFLSFIPPANVPKEDVSRFRLMAEAWKIIRRSYVGYDSISSQKMVYGAIEGMVDSLGDKGHSRFMTPDQTKEIKRVIKGHFVGIGVELQMNNGQAIVVAPLDDSPAQEAGIRPGDVIIRVNNREIKGLVIEDIVKLVQGPEKSAVVVDVKTPATGLNHTYQLIRRSIAIHNVTWHQLPGTAITHIRIGNFSKGATEDLKKALNESMNSDTNGHRALILDLRNSPGGLLEEALAVTSQFISDGVVVKVKSSDRSVEVLHAAPGGVATAVPLVVLVNGGTASAAEIVAGALQDLKRATIIGEKTIGTGTVLRQFPLSDGSALLLASYEWLTPRNRVIWHQGLEPDRLVTLPAHEKPLFPRNLKRMMPIDLGSLKDVQLLDAINAVSNMVK
jgi:carboxyl-terminal processing protease